MTSIAKTVGIRKEGQTVFDEQSDVIIQLPQNTIPDKSKLTYKVLHSSTSDSTKENRNTSQNGDIVAPLIEINIENPSNDTHDIQEALSDRILIRIPHCVNDIDGYKNNIHVFRQREGQIEHIPRCDDQTHPDNNHFTLHRRHVDVHTGDMGQFCVRCKDFKPCTLTLLTFHTELKATKQRHFAVNIEVVGVNDYFTLGKRQNQLIQSKQNENLVLYKSSSFSLPSSERASLQSVKSELTLDSKCSSFWRCLQEDTELTHDDLEHFFEIKTAHKFDVAFFHLRQKEQMCDIDGELKFGLKFHTKSMTRTLPILIEPDGTDVHMGNKLIYIFLKCT